MRVFFETIGVAFGMFSKIPVPRHVWNEKNMKYMFLAFPLVGAVIGGLWILWLWLGNVLSIPFLLLYAGFTAIPVLVTGGIHLDGYTDVTDALASYENAERRREIMNDPHVGSFAVIRTVLYFLTYFALVGSVTLNGKTAIAVALSFMLSRSLSGLAVASFPLAKNTGLAHTFAGNANKATVRKVLLVYIFVLAAGMVALDPFGGIAMVLAAGLVLLYFYRIAQDKFGGLTGDLSGWFLQKCEWWMLAALVAEQVIEAHV